MCSLCLVKIMAVLQLENSGRCQKCETFDCLSSHGCMLKHQWWISQKECNLNIVSQGASYTPRQYCTGSTHQMKTEVKTSKRNWTSYVGQEFFAFPDHSWNIITETILETVFLQQKIYFSLSCENIIELIENEW
jgi:hypothetical protein